ncbi:hypothetical protein LguiB_028284 [Lonicera macranthoides]
MGSTNSKTNATSAAEDSPSPAPAGVRRSRSSKGSIRVFQSSCLGSSSSGSNDTDNDNDEQVSDNQGKENGSEDPCADQTKSELGQVKAKCHRKVKVEQPDEITCVSSSTDLDGWGQSSLSDTMSRGGNTSARAFSSRSLNRSGRFLSRFNFFSGNISFRLNRATSIGSSRAYPVSSNDEELHSHTVPNNRLVNRSESQRGCDMLPACLFNRSPVPHYEEFPSSNLGLNPSTSGFSDNFRDDQITSSQDISRHNDNTRLGFNMSLCSPRNRSETEAIESRFDRRSGGREPVERNVRFSRTLSVGRLRDRVLRRSSLPDLLSYPLQQEREVIDDSQGSEREALEGEIGMRAYTENALISPNSSSYDPLNISSSLYGSQDYGVETSRAREARYHDLLEHRSNFLERRRRIRSQVRALQRMGSRFENLSGHERSCILSGQHRSGRCTCRISSARNANSNDNTNARASISRLVTLAEALFEVLDEIHQQTVVLSSRPSVSSIGSVPAPNDVVESLPVKLHCKSQKHLNEEDAQCYICLVEYEEGDSVRVLPCHHEFHRSCIDKWLKEIHSEVVRGFGVLSSCDAMHAHEHSKKGVGARAYGPLQFGPWLTLASAQSGCSADPGYGMAGGIVAL